jgi:hypothetical protein
MPRDPGPAKAYVNIIQQSKYLKAIYMINEELCNFRSALESGTVHWSVPILTRSCDTQ